MNISDVLAIDTIEIVDSVNDKNEAIYKLASLLKSKGALNDEALFIQDVMKRENELSTSIGFGIAIPHAISDEVSFNQVSILKTNIPFKYDDDEVTTVVMLAIAKHKADHHVRVLSQIATKLMSEKLRDKLKEAETSEQILNLFI